MAVSMAAPLQECLGDACVFTAYWMEQTVRLVPPTGFQEFHKSCRRRTASSTDLKSMRTSNSEKDHNQYSL